MGINALIIAEHDNSILHPATIAAINAATQLADSIQIIIIVIGSNCKAVAIEAAAVKFVHKVLYIDYINNNYLSTELLTDIILDVINNNPDYYTYIICGGTSFGKNLLPRIAANLDVEQISDVVKIIDSDVFERFIYSGNAMQTVKLLCNIKCLTIRVGYFNSELMPNNNIALIEQLNLLINLEKYNRQIKFLKLIKTNQEINLTNAKIVVAGGRALQNKENFALIEQLAYKLKAAIGATRTAVHAGFAPNEWQIGCSGKTIAPDLYIAVGISGAVQHVSGIKDSKIIVAINIDENAPIFQIATYKIVDDLFKIVPELINAIK